LSEADDRQLTARARSEGRSKQEAAREGIHAYLTDPVRIEDLEDELAIARYQLREQLGEVTYVSQAEARSSPGLPPPPGVRALDLRDRLGAVRDGREEAHQGSRLLHITDNPCARNTARAVSTCSALGPGTPGKG
jgi:hypothetical protein